MDRTRLKNILKVFSRRKTIDFDFESPLRRCLVFWDLFLLGVGGSVDVALYIVLGNVIRDYCGPSIVISMIIGFFVCFTSGFFYAEFASYVPTSGSDYDYVYSTLGELCGFLDGWSILVGSVIATSALAQGAADLLRSLTDSATFDYLDAHATLPDHALLASNVNIVATLIVILVNIITALGVHSSVRFNDAIVLINLLVIAFTFITGLVYVDFELWSGWDKFAPYGVNGILKSLPYTIFFYGGFICITFSTEEVIDAHKTLPRSIIASIVGIFACFFSVGTVLSLMIPYNQISSVSPLSDTFATVAFKQSKYIIAFGGFCSCFSSVLTGCYANSRLSYVMARDGLLMNFLQKVSIRTLVPVRAVLLSGLIAALLAAFCDLTILVEVCSILTLLPYVTLGISVILLRYKEQSSAYELSNGVVEMTNHHDEGPNTPAQEIPLATDNLTNNQTSLCQTNILFESKTKLRIIIALLILFLSSASISLVVHFGILYELDTPTFVTLAVIFTIPLVVSMIIICRTPCQMIKFPFTVPMFPILPTVCIAMCTFVMFQFSMWAWILFVINTVIGIIIYLGYGVKNSKVNSLNATVEATDQL
ncbi:high affinity cationic amino acid transporter 1-like [Dendronephthya gigantea]|uniref:high affinity cationic amino acid transporter 1-like n=1 Tax=Dendronephthya gigantea TaxID=151771 RepID=UPI00106DAEE5|nr:high affinity cationic amino acid transporter 1-like [Dendronephthya gigantea]